jgi:hypothetical protein
MPPLAVNLTGQAARDAVRQWILALNQLPSASSAGFVRPADVIASSTWPSGGPGNRTGSDDVWPLHLIQAPGTAVGKPDIDVGLSSESATATHPPHGGGAAFGQWHTAGQTTGYLLFDLGSSYNLETLHLWQLNQTGNFNRGLRQFDVLVAGNPSAFSGASAGNSSLWTEVLSNQVLPMSTGGNIGARNFPLSGVAARYVQIRIEGNHANGASFHTGLSEVRVTARQGGSSTVQLLSHLSGLERNDAGAVPRVSLEGNRVVIRWAPAPGEGIAQWELEVSDDLATWIPAAGAIQPLLVENLGERTLELRLPIDGAPQRFVRRRTASGLEQAGR